MEKENKEKEKEKEFTFPSDFVDGRKSLQNLREWASDHERIMSGMDEGGTLQRG